METKPEVNYKIDWVSANEKAIHNRKEYFQMLRGFLKEVHATDNVEVRSIFEKWSVHFVDLDDFPRVNIDKPGSV